MTYTLCHKNIPVLTFKTEDDEILELCEILNREHLPPGVSEKRQFCAWWKSRAIPASRQNLRNALELLGNISTERLIKKSFGLSLSDHYWAKPADSSLTWEDVTFFKNDFSEDVGKALFGTLDAQSISDISLVSPDNTSDGWLKKRWVIDKGKRVLVKGGSGESEQEPFNEVLASEICRRLQIPHVEYAITHDGHDYFSLCNDFIDENTEFIPASRIWGLKKYTGGLWEKYGHFKECCHIAGINYAKCERQICSMFFVDYIIANEDRHWGNFGFVRNPDTLEWICPAPVFDSGSSLFYKLPTNFLLEKKQVQSSEITARPFGYKHSEQIKLLPCKELCADLPLENLLGIENWFKELLEQNERIDFNRKDALCALLCERVENAAKYLK